MSTRANIIVKEGNENLIFYRHSDGYPEGTIPSLKKFVDLMKSGVVRNNISQGCGWLIILGALEYASIPRILEADEDGSPKTWEDILITDWKVGAYEPTTGIHGDIEHLYLIDMDLFKITEIQITKNWKTAKVLYVHYDANSTKGV